MQTLIASICSGDVYLSVSVCSSATCAVFLSVSLSFQMSANNLHNKDVKISYMNYTCLPTRSIMNSDVSNKRSRDLIHPKNKFNGAPVLQLYRASLSPEDQGNHFGHY